MAEIEQICDMAGIEVAKSKMADEYASLKEQTKRVPTFQSWRATYTRHSINFLTAITTKAILYPREDTATTPTSFPITAKR